MPISRAFRHCTLKKARKIATFLPFSSLLRRFTCLIMNSTPLRDEQSNIFAKQCFLKGESEKQPMAEATRMTQTQIIKELAETTGVGNKVAKQFLEKFSEIAVRETKKKGVFVMPGIGRLVRVERKARTGRNPATGESIKIPAKKVVKFRIAKSVKDAIVPPKAKKA
jgi:DNA-binding protein HU-beta